MSSADPDEFCLICNTSSSDATILHSLRAADHPGAGSNYGSGASLDEHLSVILLLRKVLCVRKSFLVSILESSGKDPSSWNIRLCQMCHRIFGEASFVWGRLKKLGEEFEQLSEILRCKLVRNVGNNPPPEKEQNETNGAAKRGRGRPGRRSVKSRVRSSKVVDSPGIVEKIRQEFLKRHDEGGKQALGEKRVRFQEDDQCEEASTSKAKRRCTLLQDSSTNLKDVKPRIQSHGKEDESLTEDGTEKSDHENLNMNDPNDSFDDMDVGAPEIDSEDDNNTADKDPDDGDFDPEDCHSGGEAEEDVDSLAEDSDFELNSSEVSNGPSKRRCRKNPFVNGERGVIHKSIKSKRGDSYECSKCQKKGFDTSSACDEHILSVHYGGKWPQNFACTVCEDRSFKGENWLRYHMKTRHPGVKLPSDELVERCIKEGTISQLMYEVVPYGPTSTKPTQDVTPAETVHPAIKTEPVDPDDPEDLVTLDDFINEDPAESCRIPVRMTNGNMRYIVVPAEFFALPEDVVAKFKEGAKEKTCDMCDKKFPTEIQYDSHFKRLHEGEKYPYFCPMCPKKFERIGHMVLQHMLLTHVRGRFHCDRCGNMFKEAILLNAHIQRVHLGIEHPYQCIKCGIRHPRRASLNKHLKRVHKLQLKCYIPERKGGRIKNSGKPPVKKKRPKLQLKYPCDECTKEFQREVKFATVEELDVHQKRLHLGIARPYPCTICKKKYSRPWLLDDHMHTHTVRSDLEVDVEVPIDTFGRYVCAPCNKEFKTKSQLDSHHKGRNHQNIKPFVCEICCQSFKGLRYLQHHQEQKHHKELNLEPSKCKYCSKILSSPRTLEDHIKIKHTKNAKFKCPHCDTYFQFETNMERHINCRHTKTTLFLCPHCPNSFTHAQYLQNHIRVHTGEKPYACKVCSKKFSDKSTFNRHVEAHSGKILDCPVCKKTGFKTRHALGVHMKVHRGIKRNSRSRAQAADNDTNTNQFFVPPEENTESNDNTSIIEDKYETDQAPQLTVPEQEMAHSSARLESMPTLYPSFKIDDTLPLNFL